MKELSDAALINELHRGRLSDSSIRLSTGMSNYRFVAGGQTGGAFFFLSPPSVQLCNALSALSPGEVIGSVTTAKGHSPGEKYTIAF